MKSLFKSEASFKRGPSGTAQPHSGLLNVAHGNLRENSIERRGANLKRLFAGAYSACYHGALIDAARRMGSSVDDSTVRASVSLVEDDNDGQGLAVEMHALLPGVDPPQALCIMEAANQTCPYSKALRGEASFTLVVD